MKMQRSNAAALLENLRRLRDEEYLLTMEHKREIMKTVLALCSGPSSRKAALPVHPDCAGLLNFAKDFTRQWELTLEHLYARPNGRTQPSSQANKELSGYIQFYRSLVMKEIQFFKGQPQARICHIGCGPMPITALMWHKYSGYTVVAVDRSREAVRRAKAVLRERLLSDPAGYDARRIAIINANGTVVSYSKFDLVILSSSLQSKPQVLERIANTGPANIKIIERIPSGLWSHLTYWESWETKAFEIEQTAQLGMLEIRRLGRLTKARVQNLCQ